MSRLLYRLSYRAAAAGDASTCRGRYRGDLRVLRIRPTQVRSEAMLIPAASTGQTLALLATFVGIGILVNVLIIYVVAQVLGERRAQPGHATSEAQLAPSAAGSGRCGARWPRASSSTTIASGSTPKRSTATCATSPTGPRSGLASDVARSIREAARVVGLYDDGELIGFARVISDGVHVAHLCDVYVLSEYRGRGFGVELVREAVDNGPHSELGWTLATRDAHGLYERFGFSPPDRELMQRRRGR